MTSRMHPGRLVVLLVVALATTGCALYWSYDESSIPRLTQSQMQEDFAYFADVLTQVCPFITANRMIFGIDIPAKLAELAARIPSCADTLAFVDLVRRGVTFSQAHHLWISETPATVYDTGIEPIKLTSIYDHAYYEGWPAWSLPLIYLDGAYVVWRPFTHNGAQVPAGSILELFDGQDVHATVQDGVEYLPMLSWDYAKGRFYRTNFMSYLCLRDPGEHVFSFRLPDATSVEMDLALDDTVQVESRDISFSEPVSYLADQETLYVKLQFMDPALVADLIRQMKQKSEGVTIGRVILDIRNNPGGIDAAWQDLLAALVAERIGYTETFGVKNTDLARQALAGSGNGALLDGDVRPLDVLDGEQFIVSENPVWIEPAADTLGHAGPVYIVVGNIYSAAGSLANLALVSDQLVSVGRRNPFILGMGISPICFVLPNSGLIFQLEPLIDLTDVETALDIMHSRVEVEVPEELPAFLDMLSYEGDVYGAEYLLNHDPFIQAALGL